MSLSRGPLFTLHKPNGELAIDNFWFEPDFKWHLPPSDISNDAQAIRSFEHWARGRIKQIPDEKSRLEQFFIRYAEALDSSDFHANFLKLWSLFEALTGGLQQRYDQNLKRAAALYQVQGL